MTNQTVEIADLIKPKFRPDQTVYLLNSDHNGINSIQRGRIEQVVFTVTFSMNMRRTAQERRTELAYYLSNLGLAREESLFASAEEAARATL